MDVLIPTKLIDNRRNNGLRNLFFIDPLRSGEGLNEKSVIIHCRASSKYLNSPHGHFFR